MIFRATHLDIATRHSAIVILLDHLHHFQYIRCRDNSLKRSAGQNINKAF